MWSVYILLCSDNSLYTGISPDVELRFKEHQKGRGGAYTRSHKPLRIVFRENVASRSAALKRELEIKSWSRQKKISFLKLRI